MDNKRVIVSINDDKAEQVLASLSMNMPLDAANLLSLMKSQEIMAQVSKTSLNLKEVIAESLNSLELVRKVPESVAFVLDKRNALEKMRQESDPVKKLFIDESGVALGIIVGSTKKEEVFELMRNFTQTVPTDDGILFFYSDLSLTIFFDDDIVSEMKFGTHYKGSTTKGLSIGDTVDRAIEIYGQPKLKSPRGAIWNKFSIFSEKNIVTSIRIQK